MLAILEVKSVIYSL